VLVAITLAAPLIAPSDPTRQDLRARLLPPIGIGAWSIGHPLGTDHLGRDVLSRILYGSRVSLAIAVSASLAATLVGVSLGLVAGYFGGRVDALVMRVADVQLAFPSILLALAVMVVLGSGLTNLVLVLALSSWIFFARIVRSEVLVLREREFVEAGRALGASHLHLIRRYILPNVLGSILVVFTLTIARAVIAEASLSFLGLGIQPPTPSWGGMLAEGRQYLANAWWTGTFPGIFLMVTVVSVNLLGDALRDALDPRLQDSG
jgi:peptide/nickel transport system permease protein